MFSAFQPGAHAAQCQSMLDMYHVPLLIGANSKSFDGYFSVRKMGQWLTLYFSCLIMSALSLAYADYNVIHPNRNKKESPSCLITLFIVDISTCRLFPLSTFTCVDIRLLSRSGLVTISQTIYPFFKRWLFFSVDEGKYSWKSLVTSTVNGFRTNQGSTLRKIFTVQRKILRVRVNKISQIAITGKNNPLIRTSWGSLVLT